MSVRTLNLCTYLEQVEINFHCGYNMSQKLSEHMGTQR